jgi:hypothetical protein
MGAGVGIGGP